MVGNGGDAGGINYPDMWGPIKNCKLKISLLFYSAALPLGTACLGASSSFRRCCFRRFVGPPD